MFYRLQNCYIIVEKNVTVILLQKKKHKQKKVRLTHFHGYFVKETPMSRSDILVSLRTFDLLIHLTE